jgi:putative hydrolase of the HAD superfamily
MTRPLAQALVLDFGGVISKTLFETHDADRACARARRPCTLKWLGPFAPVSAIRCGRAMQRRRDFSERDYWLTRSREVGRMVGEDWRDMSKPS